MEFIFNEIQFKVILMKLITYFTISLDYVFTILVG